MEDTTDNKNEEKLDIPPEIIAVLVDWYLTVTKALVESAKEEAGDAAAG